MKRILLATAGVAVVAGTARTLVRDHHAGVAVLAATSTRDTGHHVGAAVLPARQRTAADALVAAATTAATTVAKASAKATFPAILGRTGRVDLQLPVIHPVAVEQADCFRRFALGGHLHKREAP